MFIQLLYHTEAACGMCITSWIIYLVLITNVYWIVQFYIDYFTVINPHDDTIILSTITCLEYTLGPY